METLLHVGTMLPFQGGETTISHVLLLARIVGDKDMTLGFGLFQHHVPQHSFVSQVYPILVKLVGETAPNSYWFRNTPYLQLVWSSGSTWKLNMRKSMIVVPLANRFTVTRLLPPRPSGIESQVFSAGASGVRILVKISFISSIRVRRSIHSFTEKDIFFVLGSIQ